MSPLALSAILAAAGSVFRYPDFYNEELIARIAAKYELPPERVGLGSGLVGLIDIAIKALTSPGQNIVTAEITFEGYKLMARANRRECRMAKLTNNVLDNEKLKELCDENTGIVFIANPNNPTGTLLNHKDVVQLLESLPGTTYVIIDEAYGEYVTDPGFPNTLELQKTFPNLITFRTFSKVYGLAGLRIGYVIASPDVIRAFASCRIPFAVNCLAAAGAMAALGDTAFVDYCRRMNAQERDYIYSHMCSLGYRATPSAANFIYVEFSGRDEARGILGMLLMEGILVRELENFGVDWALRITVGTPEENRRLIEVLELITLNRHERK